MIKWLKEKIRTKRVKSPYDNSLGFMIWKNNNDEKSCSDGHIFLEDREYTDEEKRLEIVSYVYNVCTKDGQTFGEIYEQIETNLKINNLCEEEIVL